MQRDYYEPMDPEQRSGDDPGSERYDESTASAESMSGQVKDKASEYGDRAREQASKAGSAVMEGTESGKERAASGMHRAANQLRDRVSQGESMKSDVGVRVADQLDKSAQYLEEHETSEIWQDIEAYIKEHPMQAAFSALAAGFVFGRIMR